MHSTGTVKGLSYRLKQCKCVRNSRTIFSTHKLSKFFMNVNLQSTEMVKGLSYYPKKWRWVPNSRTVRF